MNDARLSRPVPDSLLVRPARPEDLPAMARITATAYHAVDVDTYPRDLPVPPPRSTTGDAAWIARSGEALLTDPGGCWVAEVDGVVVGCAVSRVRELMWILSSFAVAGSHQGMGVGRLLLDAASAHGAGCLRGMFAASASPAAARRYRLAGFDLHPQMFLHGTVDRASLPAITSVREGSLGDVDLMDSVDRSTRGAAHGGDHALLARQFRLLVTDRTTGSGYAYVDDAGAPVLLAASSKRAATDLLWEALAGSTEERPVAVRHVTAANQWALDVGMAARLSLRQAGYLCLRHMRPPTPYLHHGSLL
ncbi:MAG: GNAT family N-acetyltransferase [Nocardioides sp.]|uniref:GNAT family N-acetyltransferase n=1 Tax=Nocardioides sp. TaxID=35761 RepID=UPI003F0B963D